MLKFLYKQYRKIVVKIEETTTAKEKPIMPYTFPSKPNNINNEPILTMAEYPTLVDSAACNFAVIIDEIEIGTREITKI